MRSANHLYPSQSLWTDSQLSLSSHLIKLCLTYNNVHLFWTVVEKSEHLEETHTGK